LYRGEAEELSKEIVDLNEGIFSAGIISNTGESLGGYVRPAYRSRYPVDKAGWATVDFKQAMVFGSAKGTSELLSEIEAIIFIRKELKQILIWHNRKGVIITAIFDKSMNETVLCNKIRATLGLED
jgi:hypothetical protein